MQKTKATIGSSRIAFAADVFGGAFPRMFTQGGATDHAGHPDVEAASPKPHPSPRSIGCYIIRHVDGIARPGG